MVFRNGLVLSALCMVLADAAATTKHHAAKNHVHKKGVLDALEVAFDTVKNETTEFADNVADHVVEGFNKTKSWAGSVADEIAEKYDDLVDDESDEGSGSSESDDNSDEENKDDTSATTKRHVAKNHRHKKGVLDVLEVAFDTVKNETAEFADNVADHVVEGFNKTKSWAGSVADEIAEKYDDLVDDESDEGSGSSESDDNSDEENKDDTSATTKRHVAKNHRHKKGVFDVLEEAFNTTTSWAGSVADEIAESYDDLVDDEGSSSSESDDTSDEENKDDTSATTKRHVAKIHRHKKGVLDVLEVAFDTVKNETAEFADNVADHVVEGFNKTKSWAGSVADEIAEKYDDLVDDESDEGSGSSESDDNSDEENKDDASATTKRHVAKNHRHKKGVLDALEEAFNTTTSWAGSIAGEIAENYDDLVDDESDEGSDSSESDEGSGSSDDDSKKAKKHVVQRQHIARGHHKRTALTTPNATASPDVTEADDDKSGSGVLDFEDIEDLLDEDIFGDSGSWDGSLEEEVGLVILTDMSSSADFEEIAEDILFGSSESFDGSAIEDMWIPDDDDDEQDFNEGSIDIPAGQTKKLKLNLRRGDSKSSSEVVDEEVGSDSSDADDLDEALVDTDVEFASTLQRFQANHGPVITLLGSVIGALVGVLGIGVMVMSRRTSRVEASVLAVEGQDAEQAEDEAEDQTTEAEVVAETGAQEQQGEEEVAEEGQFEGSV